MAVGFLGFGGVIGTRKLSRGEEEGAGGSQKCLFKTRAVFLPRLRLRQVQLPWATVGESVCVLWWERKEATQGK